MSSDAAHRSASPEPSGAEAASSKPLPLYRQIEETLRTELESADGGSHKGLTEFGLARRFSVSRYTVRQALDRLERDGLIHRQKKRGTFPASRSMIQQPLEGIYSFDRSMTGLGLPHESRVLSLREIVATEPLVDKLELANTENRLIELVRLRSVGGEPLVLETIWLPRVLVPGIEHADLAGSMYDVLRDLYRLEVTAAQESIRPVVANARQARLLGVARGAPAFFVERISFMGETPVEVRHSLIRGDRYLYSVHLGPRRSPPSTERAEAV